MTNSHSDALVFFGATGDLAYKKIFPALQAMVKRGHLNVPVVGVAKAGWDLDRLRARAQSELSRHLIQLFLPERHGYRPCHGQQARVATAPHWCDLILFSEYFHGDNGRGCGASHQTGWTALVARLLRKFSSGRSLAVAGARQSATVGTT